MTAPYLGGHEITGAWWLGSHALNVEFTTTYASDYRYQVYVNRILSGATDTEDARSIIATAQPSLWPQEITLLAVDPANVLTDYGSVLPPRPYNQIRLNITASGWTDAEYIEITSGTVPGGAVSTSNVIGRVLFGDNGAYTFVTDPLSGSGAWYFQVAGRDGTEPTGNRGTATAVSATILAHPPDFTPQDDGNRFSLAATGGNLEIEFTEAI